MKCESIKIELYDKGDRSITTMYVEQMADNRFRMIENDLFNCKLTLGTEFETRLNNEGKHEIIRISKESDFITRRFLIPSDHKESYLRMLGDELIKKGGFWQVDMGGIATINLPKDFEYDIDQAMKDLNLRITEIIDD